MPLPPGPRARFPGELLLRFSREPLRFLTELTRDHGDVSSFRLGRERMVVINHPDHIRDVLVTNNRQFRKGRGLERAKVLLGEGLLTSEGELHLRQRRLTQPAFHRQRVAGYGAVMGAYAARTAARWRDGGRLDVSQEMMRLTLAIVGKTLFDADVEGEAAEIGAALTDVFHTFGFAVLPFGELLGRMTFLPMTRRFNRARDRLDATIYRIIAERRAAGADVDRGDLLSTLMLARDEEASDAASGAMNDEQLRDEALTLFLAGHETTANALAWTWYLLSQNPDAEARLHAEVDAALAPGEAPRAEHMAALPYARMVVAESMRLFPPAWVIGRRAVEDYEAGGYTVPARSVVLMSQYVTHRDPRFWPDPDRFDPERWTPEAQASRPKFAYYPFGGGPRVCIGEQFAWMEAVLALAAISRRWRLRYAPGHPPPVPAPMITLRVRGGMPMVAEERA